MTLSMNAIAHAAAVTAGLVLFAIGTPDKLVQPVADPVATEASAAPAVPSVATGAGVTLHSVSVELSPGDRTFPGGAAADAVNNNCLACHSAGMVLNQPALSKAAWTAEVDKMIGAYKAPVAPQDVAAIIDYLATSQGTK
jgi:hypothetical protein